MRKILLALLPGLIAAACLAQPTDIPTAPRSIPLPPPARPWGPEQATGEPDTPSAGDHQTAWASLTEDDQDEWLELDYAKPTKALLIRVYETFNPGALRRISVAAPDGKLIEVWSGQDPTWPAVPAAISEFPIKVDFPVNKVRLELASTEIPGWNEIDAVGLVDADGKTQWARSARASSTYADQVRQTTQVQQLNQLERQTVPGIPGAFMKAPAGAAKLPDNAIVSSYVKDAPQEASDYRSLGGSGHAVAFERPANARDLIAVQIYASRYGMPHPHLLRPESGRGRTRPKVTHLCSRPARMHPHVLPHSPLAYNRPYFNTGTRLFHGEETRLLRSAGYRPQRQSG